MVLHFLFYQLTLTVPLLSFYVFTHIIANTYNSPSNIGLVAAVISFKLVRPFVRVCAEGRLRQIGARMHGIISKAVFAKALKVSLLSNHGVSGSELVKIMQTDLEKIIAYP
jgi:ABC-type transport system involved in cytochrome bd biosynthesis fused ATPase/permease subunit